jgi:hypothetical protein
MLAEWFMVDSVDLSDAKTPTPIIKLTDSDDKKKSQATLLIEIGKQSKLFHDDNKDAYAEITGNIVYLYTDMQRTDAMLRLAFKAQSQCARTLEVLSSVKNPAIVYARQANFSGGHQQVNNNVPSTRTGETKNQQNELLEVNNGERLDTGAAGTAIGANQAMAAVD